MAVRSYDLEGLRADGWFERVVANVPALARLCEGLGEALVALSLAAGFRVVSAGIDRASGEISSLQWVRDGDGGTEVSDSGTPEALRAAVLAAVLGDAEQTVAAAGELDVEAQRQLVGMRTLLLAPLFGLHLARLEVPDVEEPRVVVHHDRGEESVPLAQLRRFLRSRVIDVLQQAPRNRSVSIDLEQAERARQALHAGRYDEVVETLGPWVGPLMMYLRTPEGHALDEHTRAELAKALGVLGLALDRVGRGEESEETLRLAIQYAQDGPVAGEMYRTLARVLIAQSRRPESIALIRRALTLEPAVRELVPDLALGYIEAHRGVAAIGVLRGLRDEEPARREAVEAALRARYGDRYERYVAHMRGDAATSIETDETMHD